VHRRRLVIATLVAVPLLVGSGIASSGRAAAAHVHAAKPRAAVQPHAGWCKFYDTLPMTGMSPRQMMDEMTFYPMMKQNLSPSVCAQVVADLVPARAYAMQYPTAADAMAAGYHMLAPYSPGQGAHYMGPQGFGTTFDPTTPNFLLYGGNTPSAPLVGIMWLVNSGQQPPNPGYPGGNDHWHRHFNVCFVGGIIVAEEIGAKACAAMGGGVLNISNLWMLHAWILPGKEYKPDIFRPHVPFLP
jgi:hypothetical protein